MYNVIFSKKSKSFQDKNPGYKSKILDLLKKFIRFVFGERENIDVKKMKGEWDGFYRLRSGKIRIILSIDLDKEVLYVERIGFRGDVFKDRE